MHVHADSSRYPRDWNNLDVLTYSSRGDPKKVILTAVKRGMDGIVIVEQNNLRGSFYVATVCEDLKNSFKIPKDFKVYVGEEIATPLGEFIGIGHQEGVGPYCPRDKNWREFDVGDLCEAMDKVTGQGGVVVAQHPLFEWYTELGIPLNLGKAVLCRPEVSKRVSAIETYNAAACSTEKIPGFGNVSKIFEETEKLGRKLRLAPVAGSDNHTAGWVGLGHTKFESLDIISELKRKRTHVDRSEFEKPSLSCRIAFFRTLVNPHHANEFSKNIASKLKKKI